MTANPKMFVSYSWSSPDHENWVLKLATDLRQSGIDVILDKWDLKEGHDSIAFMEKMATDPDVGKVLLVCDRLYAEKTNGRSGGVGAEAQIISAEIYQKQDQNKFVAVVKERDENGKPYLPVYYRSRIYVDFSDETQFADSFEQLVRWAFDQPLHKKPEMGQKPQYLTEESRSISLATSARYKRAVDALRNGRTNALPATAEYFEQLSAELEKFRIASSTDNEYDDLLIQSLEAFLPYRNEAVEVFTTIATHLDNADSRRMIHRFFESLIPYMDRPAFITQYRDIDWDNFRFILHELFLYVLAVYLRYERFEAAAYLLDNRYYIPADQRPDTMDSFLVFRQHVASLEKRNARLKLNRLSLHANLLHERCKGLGTGFRHIQQADFTLFVRSRSTDGLFSYWWPHTLVYGPRSVFEIFARSRSKAYLERVKVVLGVKDKTDLEPILKRISEQPPRWGFESFNTAYLLGFESLATEP